MSVDPQPSSQGDPTTSRGIKENLNERGLVPCVTQDWSTGEVLTLAYMNREALERTLDSGETHFWSRSRDELWHKGETSGNVQRVRSLRYDCDADALLALVDPAGPPATRASGPASTARSGTRLAVARGASRRWRRTDRSRAGLPEGSYTAELLAPGPIRSAPRSRRRRRRPHVPARDESDERLREEAADLLYHLGVLLQCAGSRFCRRARRAHGADGSHGRGRRRPPPNTGCR